jgi:hypothetical protein
LASSPDFPFLDAPHLALVKYVVKGIAPYAITPATIFGMAFDALYETGHINLAGDVIEDHDQLALSELGMVPGQMLSLLSHFPTPSNTCPFSRCPGWKTSPLEFDGRQTNFGGLAKTSEKDSRRNRR